jgi:hypothetical protein
LLYNSLYMKKVTTLGIVLGVVTMLGVIGSSGNNQSTGGVDSVQSSKDVPISKSSVKKVIPTCDGKAVSESCVLKGIAYEKYIYHPAIAQKSHLETVTTYKEETTGYCTLCSDGTYSPTCATGRGACSWHGGVAQWNAPIVSQVPIESTKTIVDAPAKDAYIEMIKK